MCVLGNRQTQIMTHRAPVGARKYLGYGKSTLLAPMYLPHVDEVIGGPAVAGDGEVTCLGVQGEQGQVHGAAQGQRDLRNKN